MFLTLSALQPLHIAQSLLQGVHLYLQGALLDVVLPVILLEIQEQKGIQIYMYLHRNEIITYINPNPQINAVIANFKKSLISTQITCIMINFTH